MLITFELSIFFWKQTSTKCIKVWKIKFFFQTLRHEFGRVSERKIALTFAIALKVQLSPADELYHPSFQNANPFQTKVCPRLDPIKHK